jgi:hypothetical protein
MLASTGRLEGVVRVRCGSKFFIFPFLWVVFFFFFSLEKGGAYTLIAIGR